MFLVYAGGTGGGAFSLGRLCFSGWLLCFELGEDVVGGVYEVGFCGFGSRGAGRGGLEDEVASSHEGVAGGYFLHVVSGSYAAVPGFEGDSLREAELGAWGIVLMRHCSRLK